MRALPELIAITTGSGLSADRDRTREAVWAGLPGVLLREAKLSDRELLGYAYELRMLSETLWIAIHDRAHLAKSPWVDGVHVGFRSLRPAQIREFIPADKVIGFSSHDGDGPSEWNGADYLFFSPVKETPSKLGLSEPTGFEGLKSAVSKCGLPIFALGGLAPRDVPECRAAGAYGLACLSDISMSEDPAQRVAKWRTALRATSGVDR